MMLAALLVTVNACGSTAPAASGARATPSFPTPQQPVWSVLATSTHVLGGLALDGRGHIFAAEILDGMIAKFSLSGDLLREWKPADKPVELPRVAADAQGNVYATEDGNAEAANVVEEFSSEGRSIRVWKPAGYGWLLGVAVGGDGTVFAADRFSYGIRRFSSSGQESPQWGSKGSAQGKFDEAFDVTTDTRGDVYVSEIAPNDRVQELSASGQPVRVWMGQKPGAQLEKFADPRSVAVDTRGDVYVEDYGANRIQLFAPDGHLLAVWSGPTTAPFQESTAMAIDAKGKAYVSLGTRILSSCLLASCA